jgi:hypothetical protein
MNDVGQSRFIGRLRSLARLGRINARAYAVLARTFWGERLWAVPPRPSRARPDEVAR